MKLGYQDAGSWTFLKSTPVNRLKAAWLYAQFLTSKTVSLKKTLVGLTPIRFSDIASDAMTKQAPYLGGLVEFYRSKGKHFWTPTGTNVPDYIQLSHLWWQFTGLVVSGEISASDAMDKMASSFDEILLDISKTSNSECAPLLNPEINEQEWLNRPGSPKNKINEKPTARTLPYKDLIDVWQ